MPILDLGVTAGKAAPGDRSPDALLATSGQVLMRDPTSTVVGLKYPPGYTLATDLGAAFSNSSTETTVLSAGAISGVFPAGVAIGDAVHIRAAGKYLNNTGSNQTITINLYMGATNIATAVSANAATSATIRPWQLDVEVVYTILGGVGAGAIRPMGSILTAGAIGTGYQPPSALTFIQYNEAASITLATNVASACDLKAQLSTATSGGTVTCNIFRARFFPKNY